MAWTTYQSVIALMMVITGSINTLSTKWADKVSAKGRDGIVHGFDHPFLQAVGMFLGEMSCLLVFYLIKFYRRVRGTEDRSETRPFNPLVLLPAAMCDMCGTSLMYIGLNLTFASSFQMLRGAVIIFTALLSVAFLGRSIKRIMWAGMLSIIVGLALVGASDILFPDNTGSKTQDTNGVIAGDLLIIMAQIIVAVQMVYEEKFINRYNIPPMQTVGLEGFFGFTILSILNIVFYHIDAGAFSKLPGNKLEDPIDAFIQMGNSWQILLATLGNIISIAFFNFCGISVTKELSATTRMVLDSVRTILIWIVSLSLSWQKFHYPQLIGFIILISGMCLYNNIIIVPLIQYIRERRLNRSQELEDNDTSRQPLLSESEPDLQRRSYMGGQDPSRT